MSNRRKIIKKFNEKKLLVTVDIGRRQHVGYWRMISISESKPIVFTNDRDGFEYFLSLIRAASRRYGAEGIVLGFESTGSYWKPLIHFMRASSIEVVQVNPKHTKRVKELTDNSPSKSDRKDPRVIADIIQLGRWLSVITPTGIAADLRELLHERDTLLRYQTAAYNKIHALVSVLFPELAIVLGGIRSTCARYLLRYYPTPEALSSLGIDRVTAMLEKISRKRIRAERIQTLYKAAQISVGIREGIAGMTERISNCLDHIDLYQKQIKHSEKRIRQLLAQHPDSSYPMSMKGIGIITTAAMIGELGTVDSFCRKKAVLKLTGLTLYEISSGEHVGTLHITKRGRHLLRKILYCATLNVIRKNGVLHDYYQCLVNRGVPRIKAMTTVTRKLTGILFALIHNKTPYDQEYSIQKYRSAV